VSGLSSRRLSFTLRQTQSKPAIIQLTRSFYSIAELSELGEHHQEIRAKHLSAWDPLTQGLLQVVRLPQSAKIETTRKRPAAKVRA
jgi:hypothetical protein